MFLLSDDAIYTCVCTGSCVVTSPLPCRRHLDISRAGEAWVHGGPASQVFSSGPGTVLLMLTSLMSVPKSGLRSGTMPWHPQSAIISWPGISLPYVCAWYEGTSRRVLIAHCRGCVCPSQACRSCRRPAKRCTSQRSGQQATGTHVNMTVHLPWLPLQSARPL